jgi:hypothetical protein
MREEIEKQRDSHRDAALETSGPTADLAFAAREYERGWYDALRSVLELPATVLKDEGDEKPEATPASQSEGAKRIVPERKPQSRGLY